MNDYQLEVEQGKYGNANYMSIKVELALLPDPDQQTAINDAVKQLYDTVAEIREAAS